MLFLKAIFEVVAGDLLEETNIFIAIYLRPNGNKQIPIVDIRQHILQRLETLKRLQGFETNKG